MVWCACFFNGIHHVLHRCCKWASYNPIVWLSRPVNSRAKTYCVKYFIRSESTNSILDFDLNRKTKNYFLHSLSFQKLSEYVHKAFSFFLRNWKMLYNIMICNYFISWYNKLIVISLYRRIFMIENLYLNVIIQMFTSHNKSNYYL